MGRPRAFDETEVIRSAATLFARRAYDGISVDDLVTHLGVHRNSLYKTFGSKRGLYLTALRWHLDHQVRPLLADPAGLLDRATGSADLGLLLLAAVEQAPADPEVAELIGAVLREFDDAVAGATGGLPAGALTATVLGLHLRARMTGPAEHSPPCQ